VFGLAHQILDSRAGNFPNRREKRPLVGIGIESVVEEHAVAPVTRLLLKRQCDQVAESAVGQRVLVRKEAVVRFEADVGPVLHRFCEDHRAEFACQGSRDSLFEEEPHVRAGSRTRTFQGARQIHPAAGRNEGGRVFAPTLLVEIGGQEEAGLVKEHRIDARDERLSVIITA
jgi:hypothetical protein